ncbi:MAG: hypothetical protein L6R42_002376 [Xanthoria sp. 1 TBL-2021]|nr:MAG: hypothetical protein L6R42_002376 [Xanthoria sp. 1 TBL-2021]
MGTLSNIRHGLKVVVPGVASTLGRPSTVIKIDLEHNLLAVTYRSLPVFLWDLDTFTLLGTCSLPTSARGSSSVQLPITDFVFNPNPEVELLVVAYMASELALYDTFRLTFKASVPSECDIVLYDLYTGKSKSELYKHARNCSIRSVQWNENAGIVSTADIASRLQVVKIVKDTAKGWKKSAAVLDERLSEQVMRQQLLSPDATRILVATSKWILLYDVVKKQRVAELEAHAQWWPWINHPLRPDLVLLFDHSAIRTFRWDNLKTAIPTVKFIGHEEYDIDYEHYATSEQGGKLLMKFVSSQPAQPASAHKTYHISLLISPFLANAPFSSSHTTLSTRIPSTSTSLLAPQPAS